MKRALRDQWAAALRSGEYKQGRGLLHDPVANTYDCLGVLCHLAGKDPYGKGVNNVEEDPQDTDNLSERTCDEFGITDEQAAAFVALNAGTLKDGVWKHFTFEDIAAMVDGMEAEEDGETIYETPANTLMLEKAAEMLGIEALTVSNDVIIDVCVNGFKRG